MIPIFCEHPLLSGVTKLLKLVLEKNKCGKVARRRARPKTEITVKRQNAFAVEITRTYAIVHIHTHKTCIHHISTTRRIQRAEEVKGEKIINRGRFGTKIRLLTFDCNLPQIRYCQ